MTDLFTYAEQQPRNYRRSDPVTSKEAGRAAHKFIKSDQAEILRALAVRNMAAEEISDFLGWNDSVRVCRRTKELVRAELIECTAEKHLNRSRRSAFRYRLTQQKTPAARPNAPPHV